MTGQPNKDNPSEPSSSAMTPEQIRQATQENQDRNRPDQNQNQNQTEAPGRDYEVQKNGIDELGDSKK
ncbi:MAG: hypothetical protein JWQ22_599 [Devosia sp.]|nr:hypothetical protein [Devosia sp.]